MEKCIVYLVFSLVSGHLSFVVSQDYKDLPLLKEGGEYLERKPESFPVLSTEGSNLGENDDELPSTLNTDRNVYDANVNKSKSNANNVVNIEDELPQLYLDYDSYVNRLKNKSQSENAEPGIGGGTQYEQTTVSSPEGNGYVEIRKVNLRNNNFFGKTKDQEQAKYVQQPEYNQQGELPEPLPQESDSQWYEQNKKLPQQLEELYNEHKEQLTQLRNKFEEFMNSPDLPTGNQGVPGKQLPDEHGQLDNTEETTFNSDEDQNDDRDDDVDESKEGEEEFNYNEDEKIQDSSKDQQGNNNEFIDAVTEDNINEKKEKENYAGDQIKNNKELLDTDTVFSCETYGNCTSQKTNDDDDKDEYNDDDVKHDEDKDVNDNGDKSEDEKDVYQDDGDKGEDDKDVYDNDGDKHDDNEGVNDGGDKSDDDKDVYNDEGDKSDNNEDAYDDADKGDDNEGVNDGGDKSDDDKDVYNDEGDKSDNNEDAYYDADKGDDDEGKSFDGVKHDDNEDVHDNGYKHKDDKDGYDNGDKGEDDEEDVYDDGDKPDDDEDEYDGGDKRYDEYYDVDVDLDKQHAETDEQGSDSNKTNSNSFKSVEDDSDRTDIDDYDSKETKQDDDFEDQKVKNDTDMHDDDFNNETALDDSNEHKISNDTNDKIGDNGFYKIIHAMLKSNSSQIGDHMPPSNESAVDTFPSVKSSEKWNDDDYTDKSHLFDQDDTEGDYTEDSKEERELVKEDDTNDMFGGYKVDDDDDDNDNDKDYLANKWKQYEDDENDKAVDNNEDDDFESQSESADELLLKKPKQPTAPTSMVLFYTWMIVAILIFVIGISTYQARCRGIRIPGLKAASNPKDDRKRLMENEFV